MIAQFNDMFSSSLFLRFFDGAFEALLGVIMLLFPFYFELLFLFCHFFFFVPIHIYSLRVCGWWWVQWFLQIHLTWWDKVKLWSYALGRAPNTIDSIAIFVISNFVHIPSYHCLSIYLSLLCMRCKWYYYLLAYGVQFIADFVGDNNGIRIRSSIV